MEKHHPRVPLGKCGRGEKAKGERKEGGGGEDMVGNWGRSNERN